MFGPAYSLRRFAYGSVGGSSSRSTWHLLNFESIYLIDPNSVTDVLEFIPKTCFQNLLLYSKSDVTLVPWHWRCGIDAAVSTTGACARRRVEHRLSRFCCTAVAHTHSHTSHSFLFSIRTKGFRAHIDSARIWLVVESKVGNGAVGHLHVFADCYVLRASARRLSGDRSSGFTRSHMHEINLWPSWLSVVIHLFTSLVASNFERIEFFAGEDKMQMTETLRPISDQNLFLFLDRAESVEWNLFFCHFGFSTLCSRDWFVKTQNARLCNCMQ